MAGLFVQAMLDTETSTLVKNGLYYVYLTDGETLATIYTGADEAGTVTQPLVTTDAGNAAFYASPGYYKLSRGGEPVDIQVQNEPPVAALQDSIEELGSIDFDPACYFSHAYQTFIVISDDYEIPTPDPTPQTIFYAGSDDITVTFPQSSPVRQNGQWPIVNLGSGSIEIDTGTASLSNVNSHSKVDGAGAVGLVIQTADVNDEPEYVLAGTTSA